MKNDTSINKSLLKAISILKSFTPGEPELSATDISRKDGMPKTTAHRILTTLTEGGLLDQDVNTGKYRIGRSLYIVGSMFLGTADVLKAAAPVIEILNDLTSEAVIIGIFDKGSGNVIVVMKEDSKHPVRFVVHIGMLLPAYSSSIGKAFLSEMSEVELDNLYPGERLQPITKKTITRKSELKLQLEGVRKTGAAFSREENHEGDEGCATLIRDANGSVVAGLNIAVPIFRMNPTYREQLAMLIKLGASAISYQLGYENRINSVKNIEEIRFWWEQTRETDAWETA